MAADRVLVLGCEHCVLFHVQDEQTGTQVALVAGAHVGRSPRTGSGAAPAVAAAGS